jgi:hypothetical protein
MTTTWTAACVSRQTSSWKSTFQKESCHPIPSGSDFGCRGVRYSLHRWTAEGLTNDPRAAVEKRLLGIEQQWLGAKHDKKVDLLRDLWTDQFF